MPGGPRVALVDEVNGDSICDQIPLPHGHGSVNFRFSMIPSSLKFQLSVRGTQKLRGFSCTLQNLPSTWQKIRLGSTSITVE